MSEVDILIGKVGEALTASDVADLNVMWTRGRDLKARHPEGGGCQCGYLEASLRARRGHSGRLLPLQHVGSVGDDAASRLDRRRAESENAFKVAAKTDLDWMPLGILRNGLPFNLEGFL